MLLGLAILDTLSLMINPVCEPNPASSFWKVPSNFATRMSELAFLHVYEHIYTVV